MISWKPRRPSPALIVAVVALVGGLAGTGMALPGKNTVTSNDLAKNSVSTGEIKKQAVKSSDVKDDAVKGKDIAGDTIAAADLADAEAFHRIGEAGEPTLATGGEGDCSWVPPATTGPPANPMAFYKDPYDAVHLVGALQNEDDTGGDGTCVASDPNEVEDAIVFTLPTGYRPENPTLIGLAGGEAVVIGDEAATINGQSVPGGSVVALGDSGGLVTADGSIFRAAGAGTEAIDLGALQRSSFRALGRGLGG